MGDYRKLFLVLDPNRPRSPAFDRAVELARATGASLHLGLHEHPPAIAALVRVSPSAMEQARDAWRAERERWLDGIARELIAEGVDATAEVEPRTPAHEAIAERVLELGSDLVLKDVQHESALSRVLFTPFDAHLLRLCPAPLLLVTGRHERRPRRVIAAVDTLHSDEAGALNDRIVAEARRLALMFEAELHLVHVFEGLPPPTVAMIEGIDGLDVAYDQLAQVDRERFEVFAQHHGFAAERAHLVQGFGAATLAEFAGDATTDLLVLGTNYRTGLDRLLVGSTAERLLGLARCDVLAVHPEGFDADLARHLGLKPRATRRAA